jgi:hypothetical protein
VTASGGVVAMRPRTIHSSSKSIDDQPRRVLHIEYAATVHLGRGIELAVAQQAFAADGDRCDYEPPRLKRRRWTDTARRRPYWSRDVVA